MEGKLQIFLALGAIIFLVTTLYFIRKKGLDLYHSILWLFMALLVLLFSIFPGIVTFLSRVLGIATASNAIFLFSFFFLLVIALSSSAALSRHHMRIKRLVQSVALLERRVQELEAENAALHARRTAGEDSAGEH